MPQIITIETFKMPKTCSECKYYQPQDYYFHTSDGCSITGKSPVRCAIRFRDNDCPFNINQPIYINLKEQEDGSWKKEVKYNQTESS